MIRRPPRSAPLPYTTLFRPRDRRARRAFPFRRHAAIASSSVTLHRATTSNRGNPRSAEHLPVHLSRPIPFSSALLNQPHSADVRDPTTNGTDLPSLNVLRIF